MPHVLAAGSPGPNRSRRVHFASALDAERALCGAHLGELVTADADPAGTTCQACRVELHRSGRLPYVRPPRA